MFSFQKLLHREDKLLSLLEASARQARSSVQALLSIAKNPAPSMAEQDVAFSRLHDRKITQEITDEVYSTFIAALDREDIEKLSGAIYKIPKLADKFGERYRSSPDFVRSMDFSGQLNLLDQAVEVLVQLVESLQRGLDLDRVKSFNDRLQHIEGEADKHMLGLYKELFSGKYPAVEVLVLKDLYEMLEKLIDRNRDAGNIIAHIALKSS
jgi:uncharacterized protein